MVQLFYHSKRVIITIEWMERALPVSQPGHETSSGGEVR